MTSLDQKRLECYDKEDFVKALSKLAEQYPAVFKHFVLSELREAKKYSPFNRDDERNKYIELSSQDMEYFQGTPVSLDITIPITIEENEKDS